MTPAERLAEAAQQTQLFDRISQRTGALEASRQAQAAEGRALDLAALQSASGLQSAEFSAILDASLRQPGSESVNGVPMSVFSDLSQEDQLRVIFGDTSPTAVNGIPRDIFEGLPKADQNRILGLVEEEGDVKGIPMSVFKSLSEENQQRVLLGDTTPDAVNGVPRDIFDSLPETAQNNILGIVEEVGDVKGIPMAVFSQLPPEDQRRVLLGDTAPQAVNGIPRDIFDSLPETDKNRILGLVEDAADVKGVPRDIFDNLPEAAQNRILGLENELSIQNVDGAIVGVDKTTGNASVLYQSDKSEIREVNGQLVAVNPRTNEVIPIFGEGEVAPADYRILRDTRNNVTTTIDVSTATGRAAIAAANAANAEAGTTVFTIGTMPADSTPQAKAYQVGTDTVLSYDGGRTYVSRDGQITAMPTEGVVPLSDTIAYEVMRSERVRALAGNRLKELDEGLGLVLRKGSAENPEAVSSADMGLVRDAMDAARNGTGVWSGLGALIDNVAGGMIPSEAVRQYFQDNQQSRQYLRALTILGRSALVVNPRFPVAEMERVGALFPDPDKFFRNPESEALKLIELKAIATAQLRANLDAIQQGTISDAATLQAVQANNYELERLLGLLQTVPAYAPDQGGVNDADLDFLRQTIRGG
jgi:hypothetical protein